LLQAPRGQHSPFKENISDLRSHNSGPKALLVFYVGDKAHGSAAIEAELKKASPSFEESLAVVSMPPP